MECYTFPSCPTHLHKLAASGQWLFIIHSAVFGWQRGSRPLECSPFIITSSLLDSRDKWETSKEDTNSEMHYCLSGCAEQPLGLPSLQLDCEIPSFHWADLCMIEECRINVAVGFMKCWDVNHPRLWLALYPSCRRNCCSKVYNRNAKAFDA